MKILYRMNLVFTVLAIAMPIVPPCDAQSNGTRSPEDFHIEVMGSAWILNAKGQIQANGTPADFVNDLNVTQNSATFFGQLVFKPSKRHRVVVEGAPIAISGRNTINRPIVYQGRTFNVDQTVTSDASLDYIFGGYQYDVLSGAMGHLGFSAGAAYLNATGTLEAQNASLLGAGNVTATKNQKLVLPLAGFDFRIFPIPGHKLVEMEGGIRGMAFGSYGYYAQAIGQGGVCFGPFTLLAGYRAVNTSIYVDSNGSPSGITARLKGPIFSGMFRW
jgi:hypothetical protein